MGTAGVGAFDLRAAAANFAHMIDRGPRRLEPFPDVRRRLAQPLGILEKHDSKDDVKRGLLDRVVPPQFANSALGPNGMMGMVPIVISLSTGQ